MNAIGQVRVNGLTLATIEPARVLVDSVSFTTEPGEALGIVGESGSGKSLTLRSILGMLPRGVRQMAGTVTAVGKVGMVFQDPMTALDPLASVGSQVAEAARFGGGLSKTQARTRALELMEQVRIPDAARRFDWFPGQLSGGQRQRVVIAMALAVSPDILLCDEPTTALDVTVQDRLLKLLSEERMARGMSMVFVSHNLAVVSRMCTRIVVMRGGLVVESGPTARVLASPSSPYTRMLITSVLTVPVVPGDAKGTNA